MKSKLLISRILILVLAAGMAVTSCKKDEATDEIVGNWTLESLTFDAMVGAKTLEQYLVQDAGYSQAEAQLFMTFFEALLESSMDGTINIKSDGTYTATMGGESDSGTWSLSSDGKQLTIDSSTEEPFLLEVKTLTSNTLVVAGSEVLEQDLNEDEVPETVNIDLEMTFSK